MAISHPTSPSPIGGGRPCAPSSIYFDPLYCPLLFLNVYSTQTHANISKPYLNLIVCLTFIYRQRRSIVIYAKKKKNAQYFVSQKHFLCTLAASEHRILCVAYTRWHIVDMRARSQRQTTIVYSFEYI